MKQGNEFARAPIAVVGVSALFPGSTDASGFWRDILSGRDLLTDVPASHWLIDDYFDADPQAPDKTYAKRGGFLTPVDFDALGFGIPPSTMPATDTSQLLALIVAQQVLEDVAREQIDRLDRSRISVILGVTSAQELLFSMVSRLQKPVWVKALRETGLGEDEVQAACARIAEHYVPWQEASFPGLLGNVVAGRIANRLNLGGTNCVTDAACASSFSALAMAVNELQLGDSDLVITGGVDTLNDIFMYMCFSKTPALSASGDCRPFSDQADGTMLGEGLGMVALKRLADAERDGDRIYAVLRGVGTSSDGRSKSVYAPVSEGQAKALTRAYAQAGYGPETVELVEAHGTGTKAGDVAEFEGLRQVFDASGRADRQWCALGSVKSQIGHTKAAAGAAGLFKIVMALHHKVLPPTIKVAAPNPKLGLEQSPFHLNTVARPWIRGHAHPRRASVSAFGFGGSNFHLTLEEYRGQARAERLPTQSHDLLAWSADSVAELQQKIAAVLTETRSLQAIAASSRVEFKSAQAHRLSVVADSREQLFAKLRTATETIGAQPTQAFTRADGVNYGVGAPLGEVAFLFPGQGSQYLGMGSDLAMQFEVARAVYDAAADLDFEGAHLHEVMFPRPVFAAEEKARLADRLTATEWAQPALAASSLATSAVLAELGLRPAHLAGHSFGELTALCAAGVLTPVDLIRLARARGEAMRDAARSSQGAMIAVSADRARIAALLTPDQAGVTLANHNAPNQVVLSGALAAIEGFEQVLKREGLACKRLPVASAFHSPLVAAAATQFAEAMQAVAFAPPRIATYANRTAERIAADADLRAQLADQIASPVLFVDMIDCMYQHGARIFVEVGSGSVLSGLLPSILGQRPAEVIATDRKGRSGVESLLLAVARLAALGVMMDLAPLFADVRIDAPTIRPGKMPIRISGANYGKPYPPADPTQLPKPNAIHRPTPEVGIVSERVSDPIVRSPSIDLPLPVARTESPMPAVSSEFLKTFLETQQQTAAAHSAFQKAMADSHHAYLRVAETALAGMNAMLGAPPPATLHTNLPMAPAPMAGDPQPAHGASMQTSISAAPAPAQVSTPVTTTSLPAVSPALATSTRPASAAGATVDLARVLLGVVAEKTGYPLEMLKLDMDLEGDLGIDSIKRVEILAAVEAAANLSARPDRQRLASMHTLREIVDEFGALTASPEFAAAVVTPMASPSASSPAPVLTRAPVAASADHRAAVLQVVADKTGYPVDMLNPEMDLEGDLGIDSIKRVEILAAIEERAPALAGADRSRLSSMHTLAEIISYLGELAPAAGLAESTVVSPGRLSAEAAPIALSGATPMAAEAALLAVVADKTGYPVDMLNLGMDLEGDLGVDSIKRVEILAAFEERMPALAKADRQQLSAMRTLGEIVAALPGTRAIEAVTVTKTAPVSAIASTPATVVTLGQGGMPMPNALGRYTLSRINAPAVGLAMPHLLSGQAVHVVGEASLAEALCASLTAQGVNAKVADADAHCSALIDLSGLQTVFTAEQAMQVQRQVFARARILAPRFAAEGGLLVTVQDTGGAFGVTGLDPARAWLSGFPALIKTAALEWPRAALKAIDIERGQRAPADIAKAIAGELLRGGGEIEVGLSAAGERCTLQSVLKPVRPSIGVIGNGDVVLVSGGARGVTAACIAEWAKSAKARFVLLGRTPLADEPSACQGIQDEAGLKRVLLQSAMAARESITPAELNGRVKQVLGAREVRATLEAIQQAGASASYLAVDVEDAEALRQALIGVRREQGSITGLVHAAGVLADKRIADKTDAQFDAVFGTKVRGLAALLAATATDPLKLLAVFSSVSARCGNTGQADYAMANEVIAKVARAEAKRRPGLRVKSFGWGPWEGGMVTPHLKARFAELGVPMIPLEVGARMFADDMRDARIDDIELVLGGEPRPAALLSDGADARVLALEIAVNQFSHPYLDGHAVDGQPVLPAMLAAEWFARAARGLRPGLSLLAIHDLRVLKGVRLDRFNNGGQRFRVEARAMPATDGLQWQMTLIDQDGKSRYSARVELGAEPARAGKGLPEIATEAWGDKAIYDQLLFHRGAFELIETLHGMSDQGASATLRGVQAAGWTEEPWQIDVAALDAGLQMAVLLGQHVLGAPNLPTAIGALRLFADTPAIGALRAMAYRRHSGQSEVSTDILIVDDKGRRCAELIDVRNIALTRQEWSSHAA